MTQDTTPTPNVALRPLGLHVEALYGRSTARSHSDIDIERHNMIDDCMAELIDEYRANSDTTTLTIQHALIQLQAAQDDLQGMQGDIFALLVLDRRLTVIRTLLEGVTT